MKNLMPFFDTPHEDDDGLPSRSNFDKHWYLTDPKYKELYEKTNVGEITNIERECCLCKKSLIIGTIEICAHALYKIKCKIFL